MEEVEKELKIHMIITGGTIDSYYDGSKDTVVPNKKSVVPNFIRSLKLYDKFEFTTVCMKDSRELRQEDIIKIKNTIENSPHNKFIITHGTYTMPDTARYLKANLDSKNRTIILTGSMTPLVGFSPSDAPFNLGFCIAKIQDLPPGVYTCMNGWVFTPEEIFKNMNQGVFTSIFNIR